MHSIATLILLAAAGCIVHFSDCVVTATQKEELLDAHNMYRRSVNPSASNMLQMVNDQSHTWLNCLYICNRFGMMN